MKRKLVILAIIPALLLQLAGCGGGAPTGPAADVQGYWVGETPDGAVTEWGFGKGYHIVTYEADSEAGNLETGSYTATDTELSMKGKVVPLPEGTDGEPYYTDYSVSYTVSGDELRVEYGDVKMTLNRKRHSDVCPVCREVPVFGGGFSVSSSPRRGSSSSSSEESSSEEPPSSSTSSSTSTVDSKPESEDEWSESIISQSPPIDESSSSSSIYPGPLEEDDTLGTKAPWDDGGDLIDILPPHGHREKPDDFSKVGLLTLRGTATVEYYYYESEQAYRKDVASQGIPASAINDAISFFKSDGFKGDVQSITFSGLGGEGDDSYSLSMEAGAMHQVTSKLRGRVEAESFSGAYNELPKYARDMDAGIILMEFPLTKQQDGSHSIAALSLDLTYNEDGKLVADGWFICAVVESTDRTYYRVHLEES